MPRHLCGVLHIYTYAVLCARALASNHLRGKSIVIASFRLVTDRRGYILSAPALPFIYTFAPYSVRQANCQGNFLCFAQRNEPVFNTFIAVVLRDVQWSVTLALIVYIIFEIGVFLPKKLVFPKFPYKSNAYYISAFQKIFIYFFFYYTFKKLSP